MSLKYRVRLQNDRVVGPITEQEVVELFEKNHINGEELCQLFPIGDWKKIETFKELYEKINLIKKSRSSILLEASGVIINTEAARPAEPPIDSSGVMLNTEANIKEQSGLSTKIRKYSEFKFSKNANIEVDYQELEKKHRLMNPVPVVDEDAMDKTVIVQKRPIKKSKKTTKLTLEDKKQQEKDAELEAFLREKEEAQKRSIVRLDKHEGEEEKSKSQIANEQTQFIDLKEVLPQINYQVKVSEVEFEKQAAVEENQEKYKLKIERERVLQEQLESSKGGTEDLPEKKKSKGMSWIIALAFGAIIYSLLFPDEKPKAIGPIFAQVQFPATKEYVDKVKANEELGAARSFYAENTYIKRVMASVRYINSLQNQFSENPALGELILTYSELLENTRNEKQSANTIYKLIKVSEKDLFRDASTATGAALFFGKIGKPNTGINTIKNYLRVGSKPSIKMLAVYLDLFISAGDLVEARKVFDKIKDTPKKSYEVFIPLARFLENDDKLAEAEQVIEDGLKFYPKNAILLLKQASYSLKSQSLEKFEETLQRLRMPEIETSPVYLAEYLYYLGMSKALKNKNAEAAALFKKSLMIRESDELRSKLSQLEIGGNQISQALILESKILSLLKRAKEEIANKNWDQATILSSEAMDADPAYVPAAIVLAELQIKRGLYDAAIHTLISVKDKNPNNYQILSLLIQTYLQAFKYDDAQRLLVEGSQGKYSQTPEYYYYYGLFFEGKGNTVFSVKYFDESLRRNPVNDQVMFKLATIYYKNKQFTDAKKKLSEAMILDPKNTEYQSLYALIINEQDNADTAIGYLRDIISENGEDARLLSTITSIYFRSGQIKEFKSYYKKVQALPKKDESFYEFLISASKLEESWEDFEMYSKELIKINPGNLKTKMNLAEHYIEKAKYNEAIDELVEVKEKLPSYPRVHFLMAKVYLAQNEIKKAKEMADMELKLNPNLDSAYFIVGEVFRINKDYREAVMNFEKAISKNGRSIEALTALGWVRLNQNLAAEALDLYMRAEKIDPLYPEIHRQLGFTYRALGQRSVAKENFENYLKLSPGAQDRAQIEQLIKTLK